MNPNNEIPWWRFWNPQSDMLGGVIFGTVVIIFALIFAPPIIFIFKIWWAWWLR